MLRNYGVLKTSVYLFGTFVKSSSLSVNHVFLLVSAESWGENRGDEREKEGEYFHFAKEENLVTDFISDGNCKPLCPDGEPLELDCCLPETSHLRGWPGSCWEMLWKALMLASFSSIWKHKLLSKEVSAKFDSRLMHLVSSRLITW